MFCLRTFTMRVSFALALALLVQEWSVLKRCRTSRDCCDGWR